MSVGARPTWFKSSVCKYYVQLSQHNSLICKMKKIISASGNNQEAKENTVFPWEDVSGHLIGQVLKARSFSFTRVW
jgi:hypothetical protein